MAATTMTFSLCSLLMAALFGYSASVQLNDPDWYFWFPLYACASVVNLMNWAISSKTTIRKIAKATLWIGMFLFLKVVIDDYVSGIAGFLSLDLSERVVREKTGSGLAIISMILHLEASSGPNHPITRKQREIRGYVVYGMAILVCFSFGLPFVFFVIQDGEMKFDHTPQG